MNLDFIPVLTQPDLLAAPTNVLFGHWKGATPVDDIGVAAIDPDKADTAAFNDFYDLPADEGANCVVLRARGGGNEWFVAALVLSSTRADVNKFIRKFLAASKVSFAPMDDAVERTNMAYGGITPFGLPDDWRILIDSEVMTKSHVLVGAGTRDAKIWTPTSALAELPNAEVVEGLALPVTA